MAAVAPAGFGVGSSFPGGQVARGTDDYEFAQTELARIGAELAALISSVQWQVSRDRSELLALRQQVAERSGELKPPMARPYQPHMNPEPALAEHSLLSMVERFRAELISVNTYRLSETSANGAPVAATSGKDASCYSSDNADQTKSPSRMGLIADTENSTDLVTVAESSSGQVPDVVDVAQPVLVCADAAVSASLEVENVPLVAQESSDSAVASWSSESASQDAKHEAVPALTLPSVGSVGHSTGTCTPCAFLHTTGCSLGQSCRFCHLCEATEEERGWKFKGREALQNDIAAEEPSFLWKPSLLPRPEPSTSASSEQFNDGTSTIPEQTDEVCTMVTPTVRNNMRWCDLLSDGELEVEKAARSSPPAQIAKMRSKSVGQRLTNQHKVEISSRAPGRCSGRSSLAAREDAQQGAKAGLGMPLAEIKERLSGTWTRQGERYEIDFSSWTCTKRSWAEPNGRKFKLRWNLDEDSIYWGATYQLRLCGLRESPGKVHWQSMKDAKHFQWERKL